MRILLVGSGGREHALAQALAASPTCRELHCAPGNPGIARVATCHDVAVDDLGGIVALAHHLEVGLVVIGPELPLVLGLGDALRRARIPRLRARRRALRSSRAPRRSPRSSCWPPACPPRATGRCTDATRPCAPSTSSAARAWSRPTGWRRARASRSAPIAPRRRRRSRRVSSAGRSATPAAWSSSRSCSSGDEVSLLALCHGQTAGRSRAAQDFKRVGDGDTGPNTGGMGAYSPVPW